MFSKRTSSSAFTTSSYIYSQASEVSVLYPTLTLTFPVAVNLLPGKELVHGGPLLGLAALDAVHALEDALDLGHDGRELRLDPVHLVAQAV